MYSLYYISYLFVVIYILFFFDIIKAFHLRPNLNFRLLMIRQFKNNDLSKINENVIFKFEIN